MAKKQTRRSVSLSRAMYDAIRSHATAIGKSASQYLHELAARDLEDAGIAPPKHVSAQDARSQNALTANARKSDLREAREELRQRRAEREPTGAVDTSRIPLPADAPIARMRAAGTVSVFKPLVVTKENREDARIVEAKLAGTAIAEADPTCEWCGEVAGLKRPLGPHRMHEKCAAERTRVETRTEARRKLA
jgi:hypothetical protein